MLASLEVKREFAMATMFRCHAATAATRWHASSAALAIV
jgi:hypothetical protein